MEIKEIERMIDELATEKFPVNNLLGTWFKIKSPLDRDDYILELKRRLRKSGGQRR